MYASPQARRVALMKAVAATFGLWFFSIVRGANDHCNRRCSSAAGAQISGGA
jgi:hypothetical protein